jgi:hypothetical protein
MPGLTIELPSPNVTTLRAVERLLREPRLKARVRVTRAPSHAPSAGVLRIESASVVRPVLTVLWGDEPISEAVPGDVRMALSREIWTDHAAPEAWRITAAPLPDRGRLYGTPDPRRPWVLVAPGLRVSSTQVAELTRAHDAQLHFVGLASATRENGAVCWLPRRSVLSALLGNVEAVLAPPGPLAWDAERAGVPVFQVGAEPGVPAELVARRLTRTVPTALVADPRFWQRLATDVLGDAGSSQWGTVAWLLHAREQAKEHRRESHPFKLASAKRKLRKLRRDPAAFWADSWLVRRAGQTLRGR